jgi:hypothetical protein
VAVEDGTIALLRLRFQVIGRGLGNPDSTSTNFTTLRATIHTLLPTYDSKADPIISISLRPIDATTDRATTGKRDQITSSSDKPNRLHRRNSTSPQFSSNRSYHQIPDENEQAAQQRRSALVERP